MFLLVQEHYDDNANRTRWAVRTLCITYQDQARKGNSRRGSWPPTSSSTQRSPAGVLTGSEYSASPTKKLPSVGLDASAYGVR